MKNRRRFRRILGLKGFNFVSPNPDTINIMKKIEYYDNTRAIEVLDKLLLELEGEKVVSIYCYEQSLKLWLYSERRLANVEYISLLNYVERNLSEKE